MATCCPLDSGEHSDGPSFHSFSLVRARKVYACCECREEMAIGTKHERVSGRWDGSWSTFRTCLSCVEIRDHFQCEGWIFEQLWSDLADNFFPDMKAGGPCMEGLSPEAKARLFERRLAWLEHRGGE